MSILNCDHDGNCPVLPEQRCAASACANCSLAEHCACRDCQHLIQGEVTCQTEDK